MIDSHCHSSFSIDSQMPPAQLMATALEKGILYVALTDHIDFGPSGHRFDPSEYFLHLRAERENWPQLQIAIGVEMGIQKTHASMVNEFLADQPYDFVIGSMHRAADIDFAVGDFLPGISRDEAWLCYWEETLASMKSCPDFDVLGHADIIRRYFSLKGTTVPAGARPVVSQVLQWLVEREKGLEINTSGIRYGLGEWHPQLWMIEEFFALGGKIVTIGSDSHSPDQLGFQVDQVLGQLSEIGFQEVAFFLNRKPHFLKITDLLADFGRAR